jgi:hypothetical protein
MARIRSAIVLNVEPDDAPRPYRVCWDDDGRRELRNLNEEFLDLAGFMCARKLLAGHHPSRMLTVYLAGSDRMLMHAPLGIAAATPYLSSTPVREAARVVSRRSERQCN